MNLINKTLSKIIIVLIIISLFSLNLYKVEALTLSEMEEQTKTFLDKGKSEVTNQKIQTGTIFNDLNDLGSILTTIGVGILVIVTLYMGIKYITASPESQAKLKQQLIGLVVSGVVIFGSYYIWKAVIAIVSKF